MVVRQGLGAEAETAQRKERQHKGQHEATAQTKGRKNNKQRSITRCNTLLFAIDISRLMSYNNDRVN